MSRAAESITFHVGHVLLEPLCVCVNALGISSAEWPVELPQNHNCIQDAT